MNLQELRVACLGFTERDVQIVQSLVRIVSGRKKLAWHYVESPGVKNADLLAAEVLFLMSETENAVRIYSDRRKNHGSKTVIARPEGVFPREFEANATVVRYPLRAMEILDIFDLIEREALADQRKQQKLAEANPAIVGEKISPDKVQWHQSAARHAPPATVASIASVASTSSVPHQASTHWVSTAKTTSSTAQSTFKEATTFGKKSASPLEWARPDIHNFGAPLIPGADASKSLDFSDLNDGLGTDTLMDISIVSTSDLSHAVIPAGKPVALEAPPAVEPAKPPRALPPQEKPATPSAEKTPKKSPEKVADPSGGNTDNKAPKASPKKLIEKPAEKAPEKPAKKVSEKPREKSPEKIAAKLPAPTPAVKSESDAPPKQAVISSIAQLTEALAYIREVHAELRYVDIYDHSLGWIGRVKADRNKVLASSRFLLIDRKEATTTNSFGWRLLKHNTEVTLPSGDSLMIIDREMFFWQLAYQYASSLKAVQLPLGELKLSRWPDFGILPELSGAPGILLATALLSRGEVTVRALCEESRAEESDLARLLAMCWLCGWLSIVPLKTSSDKNSDFKRPTRATVIAPERRFTSVVRRLRQFLGLNPSRR